MSGGSRTGSSIPRDVHSDRSNQEEGLVPSIVPTYRLSPSQLSLPPEYASDSNMPGQGQGRDISHLEERRDTSYQRIQPGEGNISTDRHEGSDEDNSPDVPSSSGSKKGKGLDDHGDIPAGSMAARGKSDNLRTVHYPDEHGGLLHSPLYPGSRFPPGNEAARILTSSASVTEDEPDDADEFYDWSDEEDLVDQEAKYEQRLSSAPKKKRAWGPRRYCVVLSFARAGMLIA